MANQPQLPSLDSEVKQLYSKAFPVCWALHPFMESKPSIAVEGPHLLSLYSRPYSFTYWTQLGNVGCDIGVYPLEWLFHMLWPWKSVEHDQILDLWEFWEWCVESYSIILHYHHQNISWENMVWKKMVIPQIQFQRIQRIPESVFKGEFNVYWTFILVNILLRHTHTLNMIVHWQIPHSLK